ncbi:hypothetical protein BDV29DRAFT_198028 [Aspergillus leporis]|uniref:NAD-dependent epimerase/dehydratase domain-containing protein n=1 Tax=Aspergillus leporis TaxID=41062 RepID=A0A5N5WPD2_9EURO|nr:hypothetical protein BDV29DRAFT_198028 [Aspergillus leporis]
MDTIVPEAAGSSPLPRPTPDEFFAHIYGKNAFESVIVPSFENQSGLVGILDGVNGIVSDLSFKPDPQAMIPWVVKATLKIVEAATKEPSVKRIVLTSSSSAAYTLRPDPNGRTLDSWNETAVKAAWDDKSPEKERGVTVYSASKTEGGRQAWKWIQEHRPQFQFNAVLPCVNMTPHAEIPGSTMRSTCKLLGGNTSAFSKYPEQDVARLMGIGLMDAGVTSERSFAFGEQMTWADVVRMLRELQPTNTRIPDPPDNLPRGRTDVPPRRRAEELLHVWGHRGFTPIRQRLASGIKDCGY